MLGKREEEAAIQSGLADDFKANILDCLSDIESGISMCKPTHIERWDICDNAMSYPFRCLMMRIRRFRWRCNIYDV